MGIVNLMLRVFAKVLPAARPPVAALAQTRTPALPSMKQVPRLFESMPPERQDPQKPLSSEESLKKLGVTPGASTGPNRTPPCTQAAEWNQLTRAKAGLDARINLYNKMGPSDPKLAVLGKAGAFARKMILTDGTLTPQQQSDALALVDDDLWQLTKDPSIRDAQAMELAAQGLLMKNLRR